LRVGTAELCRDLCAEEHGCRFWTWFGFGLKQKCVLKSELRRKRYRIPKPGAVSGTMFNNCRNRFHETWFRAKSLQK
jgi:hypothetical protein